MKKTVRVNWQIPGTKSRITEITVVPPKNGRIYSGVMDVEDRSSGIKRKHEWMATYKGVGSWEVTGQGAILKNGLERSPDKIRYPFTLDPLENIGLIDLIVDAVVKFRINELVSEQPEIKILPQKSSNRKGTAKRYKVYRS